MKKNNKEKDKAAEEAPKKEFKLMDSEVGLKMRTTVKSETFRFVLGLMSVIFAVYMLLSFSSFFFTGGSDQSILSHPVPGELASSDTQIENYTGAQGAQLDTEVCITKRRYASGPVGTAAETAGTSGHDLNSLTDSVAAFYDIKESRPRTGEDFNGSGALLSGLIIVMFYSFHCTAFSLTQKKL